jgi:signal transduction histidine kinase
VLYVTFDLEEEILGRLFLFSSHPRKSVGSELRLLNEVVRQLGPAVYNVYELRRLRSRAAAMERAWIARELHDGAIQALAGITMRLYVLRKKLLAEHNLVGGEVEEIQRLLSDQIVNLRRLIQHVKPVDVDPRRLLDTLAATIDQFRSDTGIATKFVSDLHEIIVPARISREILQIVREALVNIHKHSHATNVLVRVAAERGHWVIVIEDNGRGFEFVGRLRQSELDAARQGPTIIKERVRSCGGELLIESTPGRGARLEVMIPQVAEEVHA